MMWNTVETGIVIQKFPPPTSPNSRVNAYNRHSFAPWIRETGYLTPAYLHRRDQARQPFNMSRWITPKISETMLSQPSVVIKLDKQVVKGLLEIAAACDYDVAKAQEPDHKKQLDQMANAWAALPESNSGYFVRLSESSPRDVDDGNLQPVYTIAEALLKLVCSKRAVQALLAVYEAEDERKDNSLYFFPYYSGLDRLSEWRCYVHEQHVVAISQSRFYQPHHARVTDEALELMVMQVRRLWLRIAPECEFASCALDVYAEVHRPDFEVKLIEINPYGPLLGSGSLLFHWLDHGSILCPPVHIFENLTVLRLVQHNAENVATPLGRQEAYEIGRAGIISDELAVLRREGLEWLLEPEHHARLMSLPVPGGRVGVTTQKARLERFRRETGGIVEPLMDQNAYKVEDHPRFRKLQEAYIADKMKPVPDDPRAG